MKSGLLLFVAVVVGLGLCHVFTGCEDDDDDPETIVVTNEQGQVVEVPVPAEEGEDDMADGDGLADGGEAPEEGEEAPPEEELTPDELPPLASPALLAPDDGATFTARAGVATVTLSWDSVDGADGYIVEIGSEVHDTGSDTSYVFTGGPGVYSWRAIAARGDEHGWIERPSGWRQFTIAAF